jgi:hypothetical protein
VLLHVWLPFFGPALLADAPFSSSLSALLTGHHVQGVVQIEIGKVS